MNQIPDGLVTGSSRLAPCVSPAALSRKNRYSGCPAYVTCWTADNAGESISVRVTVPSSLGLTPGPAIGGPLVSNAGQRSLSHGVPRGFGLSLHANGGVLGESAWSWSEVSTYNEQPA
jgi:hypothetical protein